MSKNVTAIIPAFNEAENIEKTVSCLKRIGLIDEIIVVDDGSKDNTYEVLSKLLDIKIIRHRTNKGKGYAVKSALPEVKNSYVVLVDADLCESAYEIKSLVDEIEQRDNSMIIGKLPPPVKKGGFGIVKYTAKKGFKLLTSKELGSILSGQRAMPLSFLKAIDIPNNFGLEFKLSVEAVKRNIEIIEVPVNIRHRETGRNLRGFLHRGKQFTHILQTIIKEVI